MTTTEKRVSQLEAEKPEIKAHFATKADLYRMMLGQTGLIAVGVGVILRFG